MFRRPIALLAAAVFVLVAGAAMPAHAAPAAHERAASHATPAAPAIQVYNAWDICWVLDPNRTPNGYGIAKTNQFSYTDSAHTIHVFTQCGYTPNRLDLPNYGNGCRLYDQAQPVNGPERASASDFVPSPNLDYPLICPAKGT